MTEREKKFLDIIRNYEDPKLALEVAIAVISEYLEEKRQCKNT